MFTAARTEEPHRHNVSSRYIVRLSMSDNNLPFQTHLDVSTNYITLHCLFSSYITRQRNLSRLIKASGPGYMITIHGLTDGSKWRVFVLSLRLVNASFYSLVVNKFKFKEATIHFHLYFHMEVIKKCDQLYNTAR